MRSVTNPVETAPNAFRDSTQLTKKLTENIKGQSWTLPKETWMKEEKNKIIRRKREEEKRHLVQVKEKIRDAEKPPLQVKDKIRETEKPPTHASGAQPPLLKMLECASAKGASNWLTSLPLQDENRVLSKADFTGALALRYGWRRRIFLKSVPATRTTRSHTALTARLAGT